MFESPLKRRQTESRGRSESPIKESASDFNSPIAIVKHSKLNNLEAIDETDSFGTDRSYVTEEKQQSRRNQFDSPIKKHKIVSELSEEEL